MEVKIFIHLVIIINVKIWSKYLILYYNKYNLPVNLKQTLFYNIIYVGTYKTYRLHSSFLNKIIKSWMKNTRKINLRN